VVEENAMAQGDAAVPVGSTAAPLLTVAVGLIVIASIAAMCPRSCSTTQSASSRQSGALGELSEMLKFLFLVWFTIAALPVVVEVAMTLTLIESLASRKGRLEY
jgi:hypothetical protein